MGKRKKLDDLDLQTYPINLVYSKQTSVSVRAFIYFRFCWDPTRWPHKVSSIL